MSHPTLSHPARGVPAAPPSRRTLLAAMRPILSGSILSGPILSGAILPRAGAAAGQQPQPQWSPARAPPDAHRSGMTLTFAEEFADFVWSMDGRRGWRTNFPYGRTLPTNKEAQYYSDASVGAHPFRLQDGVLEISAAPGENRGRLPYVSGMITTQGAGTGGGAGSGFAQRYGHFECRAQVPRGRGLWPAFWLLPADNSWPPEIDVMEVLGHQPTTIYVSTHSKASGKREARTLPVMVGDLSAGFHTYGMSWRADEIRYFLDGRQIAALPTPADMHKPMFLLANLGVGGVGSWPGPPDERTVFPATLRLAHIRAWRFDAE